MLVFPVEARFGRACCACRRSRTLGWRPDSVLSDKVEHHCWQSPSPGPGRVTFLQAVPDTLDTPRLLNPSFQSHCQAPGRGVRYVVGMAASFHESALCSPGPALPLLSVALRPEHELSATPRFSCSRHLQRSRAAMSSLNQSHLLQILQ